MYSQMLTTLAITRPPSYGFNGSSKSMQKKKEREVKSMPDITPLETATIDWLPLVFLFFGNYELVISNF